MTRSGIVEGNMYRIRKQANLILNEATRSLLSNFFLSYDPIASPFDVARKNRSFGKERKRGKERERGRKKEREGEGKYTGTAMLAVSAREKTRRARERSRRITAGDEFKNATALRWSRRWRIGAACPGHEGDKSWRILLTSSCRFHPVARE